MKRQFLLLGALFVLLFASCEPETYVTYTFGIRHDKDLADYEKVATNASPYNSTDYPDFSSVIMFSYSLDGSDSDDYVASGVLITPDWILTAGHNFFVAEEQDSPAPPEGIYVLTGNDPNNPTNTYPVEELVFFPTWIEINEDFLNANDLCLVKLSSPINNITPAQVNSSMSEPLNSTLWFCGFGDYSQQDGQDPNLFSKKHAIENILDRKVDGISTSDGSTSYTGGLLAFDFDSPDGEINSLDDDEVNSDEALLGTGSSGAIATEFEGATIQGDSGGPIFIKIDGEWKVCGILSGGANEPFYGYEDGGYGDISVFIRVANHYDWIQSVIQ